VFKDLIKKIAAEFARRDIPYMVIGGQAVLLYGEPRLTKDIDITLGLGVEELACVMAAVEALNLTVQVKDVESFVRETMVLPVVDVPSGIRVDLVFSFTPYERKAVENAVLLKWDNTTVRFATLEDLVIHKIVAGRARDIEDVRIVLLKNPGFNRDYIRKWLVEFDQALDGGLLRLFDSITSER